MLWIRDILVWVTIRIRITDLRIWIRILIFSVSGGPKIKFFKKIFAYYFLKVHLHQILLFFVSG
jgi:hypothetical protein